MTIKLPNLSPHDFLYEYLRLIGLYTTPLTDVEAKILIAFALLPASYEHFRFSSRGRRMALEFLSKTYSLSFSSQAINNHIYSLLRKGFLIRSEEDRVIYVEQKVLKPLQKFLSSPNFIANIVFPREVHTEDKN